MIESFPRQSAATRNFQLGAPRSFHICKSGDQVLFLRSDSGRDSVNSLWIYDVAKRVETKFADPRVLLADDAEVPSAERARRERMRETTSGITSYSTDDSGTKVAFALSGQLFVGQISSSSELKNLNVEGPVIDRRLSPDGNFVAWSNGKDLFITNFSGNEVRNLTNEKTDKVDMPATITKTTERSDLAKLSLAELNQLLTEVLEQEDYIRAIDIRDEINKRNEPKQP